MRHRLLMQLLWLPWLASSLAAQQCPGGTGSVGDVGIVGIACMGPAASCAINVRSGTDRLPRHVFAVEPVIEALAPWMDLLRPGDVLVAVDSILITTAAGGERLARLRPGSLARLLVRRGGVLREVRVRTAEGCGIRSLKVSR